MTTQDPSHEESLPTRAAARDAAEMLAALAGRPLFAEALRAQLNEVSREFASSTFTNINRSISEAIKLPAAGFSDALSQLTVAQARLLMPHAVATALTEPENYRNPDPPRGTYSAFMKSAATYFDRDNDEPIDSVESLNGAIEKLVSKTPDLRLVWRGARDATWGVHSHLYRQLMAQNGVEAPSARPRTAQPYPDEDQMVAAEAEILRVARSEWRLDGLSALETFARIQHAGGPTRLLDVTKNPYVAAWFAVEANGETDASDARLIAFATEPVPPKDRPELPTSIVELDSEWGGRLPAWHLWADPTARQAVDWGTGARRRLWVPPTYDPRISAQNAAFIIDGVPITSAKTAPYFSTGREKPRYFRRADLLAASSIYAKIYKPAQKPQPNKQNLAPTFTFRITTAAKPRIRNYLESRFGYTRAYIYPDVIELARHVSSMDFPPLNGGSA